MKTLTELHRITLNTGKQTPFTPIEPRRERRRCKREQLRQMKRTADGSGIDVNQSRKDFDSFEFG